MSVSPENRKYYKPLSLLVSRMVPDYMLAEYPQLILFMERYFEYMERQAGEYDIVSNLLNYRDIDNTLPMFEESFKKRFLGSFPEALASNVDILIKNIRAFYKSKGTEDSFRFIFKVLFNSDMEIFYPKTKILKASDGIWYNPEYLIFEDADGNIPPLHSNGQPFNQRILGGEYIFGVTTGASALLEGTTHILYDGELREHFRMLSKEGKFVVGEQIVLGDNGIENGDFNDHTNFWKKSVNDNFIKTNILNELEITQNPVDVFPRYLSQRVVVKPHEQYFLRYSLVANKTGLVDSSPRFDSDLSRVTVGSTEGGNDLFDSGHIGSYVNLDSSSMSGIDRNLRWQPAGDVNGVVQVYHINHDIHTDPASLTPVGSNLVVKSTARVIEVTSTPRFNKNISAALHVDPILDQISFINHDFKSADVITIDDNGNTLPTGLSTGTEYYVIIVDADTIALAASKADVATYTKVDITTVGSGTITLKTPPRIHLSDYVDSNDFVDKTTIHPTNGHILLVPYECTLTDTNFYVWSSTASYSRDDYVIKDDVLYKSLKSGVNMTDPTTPSTSDWVKIPSALVNGEVELGSLNTLKLLPELNSTQDVVWITVHNEMLYGNQRSTFDGISFVKRDAEIDMPSLFIANRNGESGIVTRTLTTSLEIDAAVDVEPSDNTITYYDSVSDIGHQYQTADIVTLFDNGNTLPVGLLSGVDYYTIIVDETTFQLALSADDARLKKAIDITAIGSGNITLTTVSKGQWYDTRGFLSADMKLQDNDYYQEYSYVIRSGVSKIDFEQVIRDNLHPAGLKMWAEVQTLASDDSGEFDNSLSILMEYYLRLKESYLTGGKWKNSFDASADVTPSTDSITVVNHGYHTGQVVRLRALGNTIPTGLSDNTQYFIVVVDDNTIKLANNFQYAMAGVTVDISAVGSGSIFIYKDSMDVHIAMNLNLRTDFGTVRQTYADVEMYRESLLYNPLQSNLHETVASLPVGIFDSKADEYFPWQDSFEVDITP